jgi:truncated hemoglobin YjbI
MWPLEVIIALNEREAAKAEQKLREDDFERWLRLPEKARTSIQLPKAFRSICADPARN